MRGFIHNFYLFSDSLLGIAPKSPAYQMTDSEGIHTSGFLVFSPVFLISHKKKKLNIFGKFETVAMKA